MPEITANIVVEPIQLSVTDTTQNLDVVVDSTNLNIYTATGIAKPAGNVGELQYHATGNIFGAIANSNVDAGGNLVFTNLSNLKIAGGTSAYYLQTDGTGNLTWAAGGTPTGNGVPSGANTQIQLSDGSGSFDSGVGFTFDKATNILNVPGNVDITGIFNGDGGGLSNIVGANVTGTVANATHASTANTVTTAAQPNITSVGTLTSLEVSGTSSIYEAIENVNLIGAQTGTYNFDLLDGSIQYSTANAAANLILNFRGNSTITTDTLLSNGKSITSTYIITTGSTPYEITQIQIDGSNANVKWAGGSAPVVFSNAQTAYTYTIVKTSTTPTYDIFASATRYL